MNLTINSSSSPSVSTQSIERTAAAIATPASPVYDSELLESSSATAWNEFAIIPDDLTATVYFESGSPSICSVSILGAVTRNAAGFGIVYVASGAGKSRKKLLLDMRDIGSSVVTEFSQYTPDSLADKCAIETQAMLATGGDLNYYSIIDHNASTYTRNNSCWLDVDLSAVSVANRDPGGEWRHTRAGTAITSRHVAFAAHYAPPVNSELRFVNASGTVFTYTILAYHGAVSSGDDVLDDLKIAVVSSTIDASIEPMQIAGSWAMQGLNIINGSNATYYIGGLACWIDQLKKCYATHVGNRKSTVFTAHRTGTFNAVEYSEVILEGKTEFINTQAESPYLDGYAGFLKLPVTGDSGCPVMFVISGLPVLLWTWRTNNSGTPFYASEILVNARIAGADSAAGISTGLTANVAPDPTL